MNAVDARAADILGVRIHDVTAQETLARVEQMVADGKCHQIVTVNPEFVMLARRDRAFRRVLERADLALPDGAGILWAARRLGQPLRERVTGVDTVWRLAALAARRGHRIFLLGAAEGVAERAARRLQRDHPDLIVGGTWSGSPVPREAEEIIARVRSARPDLLFVAFGAPQQDIWIARHRQALGVPVSMGVGGAFDFIAGVTRRAPPWMQKHGVEWLHRLWHQPWRWRRMLVLPRFAALAITGGRGRREKA